MVTKPQVHMIVRAARKVLRETKGKASKKVVPTDLCLVEILTGEHRTRTKGVYYSFGVAKVMLPLRPSMGTRREMLLVLCHELAHAAQSRNEDTGRFLSYRRVTKKIHELNIWLDNTKEIEAERIAVKAAKINVDGMRLFRVPALDHKWRRRMRGWRYGSR